jgi:hypothetical protein
MAKNFIPNNVKEISIFFYYYDTEAFLENCHHNLEMINLNY